MGLNEAEVDIKQLNVVKDVMKSLTIIGAAYSNLTQFRCKRAIEWTMNLNHELKNTGFVLGLVRCESN